MYTSGTIERCSLRAKEDTFVADHLFECASVNSLLGAINLREGHRASAERRVRAIVLSCSRRHITTSREKLETPYPYAESSGKMYNPLLCGDGEGERTSEPRKSRGLLWAFPTRISWISSRNCRHPLLRTTTVDVLHEGSCEFFR